MRGHIRKRGSGYQIIVDMGRDPVTNKRKQKSVGGFKKKIDAEKALAQLITKIERGEHFETQNMELSQYLQHWLITYAKVNVAPSTYIRYTQFVTIITDKIGTIELSKLKPLHIQNFYNNLISENRLSNSTILKVHRLLHLAFKHAIGWQTMLINPCQSVQPPRAEKIEMTVWDIDSVNYFLDSIKESTIFIAVVIALQTGMREGEISALKWENIDFDHKMIYVTHSLQRIEGQLVRKVPKTKKSIRPIAMIQNTINILQEHADEQEKIKSESDGYCDSGFVIAWPDGRPYDPHYISKKFAQIIKSINKELKNNNKKELPVIRFHDLRHTHATLLLKQGVNPKIVSERLGHSTVSITLDLYSHVLPNMQKEAAQKLDLLFN